ncbi:MAG: sigma-70 family RNA polymerase sigma factor, partial [Actinobacteria bacterium]|nr:sigma-70 family RNA polymerase sigma factor [Actinomycetota bacterium]
MPIGIYFEAKNLTADTYAAINARLGDLDNPPGRTFHASFHIDDQLHVFDVWESSDAFDAFGAVLLPLLAEYGAAIGGVAYLIIRDGADAEEIVMDTLVTAWRRVDQLRDDAALRTWLLRIATRHALSRRRRRRPTQPLAEASSMPAHASRTLDRVVIAEALAELPQRMRAAVALHHVAGLSVRETAEAMGTSENTVKSHLRDGMKRLRAALEVPERAQ